MTDNVSKTLQKWRQTQFGYDNEKDCLLSLADYLVDCGYRDFGVKFRGTFSTEKGAYHHVEKYGGEEFIIAETGLTETSSPKRGDIVLVEMNRKVAGIFLGENIAFRTSRGVIEVNVRFLKIFKAWKVEQCPPLVP